MIKSEFKRRRKKLMNMLGDDCIGIVPSAPIKFKSRNVPYRYRQDSNFYYLTGFPEPHAIAVFRPGAPNGEYLLFCKEKSSSEAMAHELYGGLEEVNKVTF